MSELKMKYADLLSFGQTLGLTGLEAVQEGAKLKIRGQAPYQLEKNLFWDKIKEHADWQTEIGADIHVTNADLYGIYTVQKGDTLSAIAKKHLGAPNRYVDIFNLNKDVLSNPDVIRVGQKLKIPNP
jgi:LysM repeat protein